MAKINVRVCLGTTCYVMGASELLGLLEGLPAELRGRIEVAGSNCLNLCQQGAFGRAPFVYWLGHQILNLERRVRFP